MQSGATVSSMTREKELPPKHWASQVALLVKNLPANAADIRDMGSILGSGRSPGGGHGNPFQYSCLENPMVRGASWATVLRIAKNQTQLKRLGTCAGMHWVKKFDLAYVCISGCWLEFCRPQSHEEVVCFCVISQVWSRENFFY